MPGTTAQPTDLNGNGGYIVLRSALPPEQMENALRATVRSIDAQLPLTQVQTMEQVVSQSEAPRRFNTIIISSFALAAVLLAVLGIYSVIAFSVASRVQEMAIRMALGSQRSHIMRLILISGLKLAAIGCVLGLAGAAAASSVLRSFLFHVSPFDPMVMILTAIAVFALALAASAIARAPRCLGRSHPGFARGIDRSMSAGSSAVLVVAYLLQPVDDLAVELFLNGDMGHGRGRRLLRASASRRVQTRRHLPAGSPRLGRPSAARGHSRR